MAALRREIFCLLLSIALFCFFWMRSLEQVAVQKGVAGFSIMQLELPRDENALYSRIDEINHAGAKAAVVKNLRVDYFFMLGVYPGIAVWLLIVRRGVRKGLALVLLVLAVIQVIPWLLDVNENNVLISVLNGQPLKMPLALFKNLVYLKFLLALGGTAVALITGLFRLIKPERVLRRTKVAAPKRGPAEKDLRYS